MVIEFTDDDSAINKIGVIDELFITPGPFVSPLNCGGAVIKAV